MRVVVTDWEARDLRSYLVMICSNEIIAEYLFGQHERQESARNCFAHSSPGAITAKMHLCCAEISLQMEACQAALFCLRSLMWLAYADLEADVACMCRS